MMMSLFLAMWEEFEMMSLILSMWEEFEMMSLILAMWEELAYYDVIDVSKIRRVLCVIVLVHHHNYWCHWERGKDGGWEREEGREKEVGGGGGEKEREIEYIGNSGWLFSVLIYTIPHSQLPLCTD